jgi:hypothetical protein
VEIELELDVLPDFVELGKSLFHFGLLTSLVGNFFNIFLVLVQIEVVDISESKFGVNSEVNLDLLSDRVPMALAHCGVTELRNERQELKPFLDLLKDTNGGVAALFNLHFFEGFLELFDFIFHFGGFEVLPSGGLVLLEDVLAVGDMLPKQFHVVDLQLDDIYLLHGVIDEAGVAKLRGDVAELVDFVLKIANFTVDTLEFLNGLILSTVVFVEVALFHLLGVVFLVFLQLVNSVVVLRGFLGHKRADFLLHILG